PLARQRRVPGPCPTRVFLRRSPRDTFRSMQTSAGGDRVQRRTPPHVSGWTPLGCALAYRRDPLAFLRQQRARFGPLFTLDLAGFALTVIGEIEPATQFLRARDDQVSARNAQAEIGFEVMLGKSAVAIATDVHQLLLTRERRLWAGDLEARL